MKYLSELRKRTFAIPSLYITSCFSIRIESIVCYVKNYGSRVFTFSYIFRFLLENNVNTENKRAITSSCVACLTTFLVEDTSERSYGIAIAFTICTGHLLPTVSELFFSLCVTSEFFRIKFSRRDKVKFSRKEHARAEEIEITSPSSLIILMFTNGCSNFYICETRRSNLTLITMPSL